VLRRLVGERTVALASPVSKRRQWPKALTATLSNSAGVATEADIAALKADSASSS
jgi:hypothetical protein